MRSPDPLVSVLLPAKNAAPLIGEAIESLRAQSRIDWELLVADDGSSDGTADVVASWNDPRIRLFTHSECRGVAHRLNQMEAVARGRFIARMDADDRARPERLSRQMHFLETHPDCSLCGTAVQTFGACSQIYRLPREHDRIRAWLLFQPSLVHPTVLWRREVFRHHQLSYQENPPTAEDYELWIRASDRVRLANLPEVLLEYRVDESTKDSEYLRQQRRGDTALKQRWLERLGLPAGTKAQELHQIVARREWESRQVDSAAVAEWIHRLGEANRQRRIFATKALEALLTERIYGLAGAGGWDLGRTWRHLRKVAESHRAQASGWAVRMVLRRVLLGGKRRRMTQMEMTP